MANVYGRCEKLKCEKLKLPIRNSTGMVAAALRKQYKIMICVAYAHYRKFHYWRIITPAVAHNLCF